MAYENYTVIQFENALFKDDRSVLTEEELKEVYNEYIDTAGLYNSEEFDKVTYIHFLNNRINTIKIAIKLQKDFLKEFSIPYLPNLRLLQEFGYYINWNKDKIDFIRQLDNMEMNEGSFVSELENSIKELNDLKELNNRNKPTYTKQQSRESFVRTRISLSKLGYKIYNDRTTVEELALMIKDQKEQAERL